MEFLDIVDKNGEPTGDIVERTTAHRYGIRHRTSHVWLLRDVETENGVQRQVLLQKRSEEKDSFPGCLDISSAGHIPAESGFLESAVRELKEELGVELPQSALVFLGKRTISSSDVFHGQPFNDEQITSIYYAACDLDEKDFVLQKEEVSDVVWMDLAECKQKIHDNTIKHCIYQYEINMLPESGIL